ncbi:NAD(P)-dependent oxidoreductase [Paenibacillus sp. TRM 82003]|nr:NAD(P)-dependent oxidoreductase [Paenibacillus sp. TRM 82003]
MSLPEKGGLRVVAVTGISSFIGYHVACRLAERGYAVIGTMSKALSNYEGLRRQRLDFAAAAGVRLAKLDITNAEETRRFIECEKPGVWVQHAGMATNYASLDYDLDAAHRVNVSPLATIYKALKQAGCRGVIVTGSGEEYSMLPSLCFEEDPCWPMTPYGMSKLSETVRAFQLSQQFELPTRVARVFIPYGPLDASGKLLPTVVSALREGRQVELSDCTQKRDFLHIDDLADGYVRMIDDLSVREALFDIFNLCGGEGVTLRKLLLETAQLMGADPALLSFGRLPMREGEAGLRAGSNEKAKALLQWKPRSLREGLAKYVREEGAQ